MEWRDVTKIPNFDCRVFSVPDNIEAMNAILWREYDSIKNSISSLAHSEFSHKSLHKKHGDDMKSMLAEKGIMWDNLEQWKKVGTYIKREIRIGKFIKDEIESLPLKHNARLNPNLTFERSYIVESNEYLTNKSTEERIRFIFGE